MTKLLLKTFIPKSMLENKGTKREAYGMFAGIVGIVTNVILFAIKFVVGLFLNSIAIMADSFNNLSDTGSSLVTLIGFKFGAKPADKEHPFGHGRMEYITSFIISFIILILGYEFLVSSVKKIFKPEDVGMSVLSLVLLGLAIGAKLWQSFFYRHLAKEIDSNALFALSQDSRNDVIVTSVTVFSVVFTHFTHIIIDGYVGVFVALLLLWSGYGIAKEAISSLLGESVDYELAKKIKQTVLEYDGIVGVHDLIVHNYGPNNSMATLHAEVPDDRPIIELHEVIDKAEVEISEKYGVALVIHMDPISTTDEQLISLSNAVEEVIAGKDSRLGAHDFRLVRGNEITNFIFDLEIPREYSGTEMRETVSAIKKRIREMDKKYKCVINVEYGFIMK